MEEAKETLDTLAHTSTQITTKIVQMRITKSTLLMNATSESTNEQTCFN